MKALIKRHKIFKIQKRHGRSNRLSIRTAVKQVLVAQQDKKYEKELAERRMTYEQWAVKQDQTIAEAYAETAGAQGGAGMAEFVIWRQQAGKLAENVTEHINAYFVNHPEAEIVYGDEDLLSENGERCIPWYKPCWSPDTYRAYFYVGSVIAVRSRLLQKAGEDAGVTSAESTGKEIVFSKASGIRPLMDRLFLEAGGFRRNCHTIGHMEEVLFHGTFAKGNMEIQGPQEAEDADTTPDKEKVKQGQILGEEHKNLGKQTPGEESLACEQTPWEEYRLAKESPQLAINLASEAAEEAKELFSGDLTVSVIIPSKDNPEVLEKCLFSLTGQPERSTPIEILLVDNGSNEENKKKTENLVAQMRDRGTKIRYLYEPMEFNFSGMCNLGAEAAEGKFLLFLNDDIELCGSEWLDKMVVKAMLPYVGCVGLKLYYPGSVKIQHDGIVNLPVGPVHKLQFMDDDRSYYFGRNRYDQNCVAVTGACLLLRTEIFREAGGFREALRVAYNDVELGFRLTEMGYFNVVLNDCYAYHYESLSRGNDETPEKIQRLAAERALLYQMHPQFRGRDPFYPVGLNREGLDSRVVPAYITDRNVLQDPGWIPFTEQLQNIRKDDCLMARVETAGPGRIQGYSVILGDDNACYEKYLLLIPAENQVTQDMQSVQDTRSTEDTIWSMKLRSAYRQELEENLPDQKNVALGGFCVSRTGEQLPAGTYHIAVLAVNRVSKLQLWNDTGKYMVVETSAPEE